MKHKHSKYIVTDDFGIKRWQKDYISNGCKGIDCMVWHICDSMADCL